MMNISPESEMRGSEEPSVSGLQARPLGQLLVMQSVVGTLPDEQSIFSFVCRGLEDVPGVTTVSYLKNPAEASASESSSARFPLIVNSSCYGELQVHLVDPIAFAPYEAYLENFAVMLAVILEERHQRKLKERHEEELEYFSYTITHDLRAPLRAMSGYGEILQDETGLSPSARDYLQRIISTSQRMDRLITDSLNYSSLVRQGMSLKPVNIKVLLCDMILSYPNLQPAIVEVFLEGDVPLLEGNEAALTQCFSNLLNNSIKFVQPGQKPKVVIRAEEKGRWVRLWFHDNGIGISQENQQKIFGMFQRLNPNCEGTGIGLALVKKAVERMGGSVGVESQEDKGSRFWLELKKAKADEAVL